MRGLQGCQGGNDGLEKQYTSLTSMMMASFATSTTIKHHPHIVWLPQALQRTCPEGDCTAAQHLPMMYDATGNAKVVS